MNPLKGSWSFVLVMLAIALVLGLAMRLSMKGARPVRAGRVTGVIGRKGHGKSLFLVHEMLRSVGRWQRCQICSAARMVTQDEARSLGLVVPAGLAVGDFVLKPYEAVNHQVTVASNCALQLPAHFKWCKPDCVGVHFRLVQSWEDLFSLPHLTFAVVDEIGMEGWAPASQTTKGLPVRAVWFLAQCRKLGVEFEWCAQREDRVTAGLRAQTDEIGFCRRGMFRQMRVQFIEPEDVQKLRGRAKGFKPLWVYRYRVTKKLGLAYNTFQMVQPPAAESSGGLVSGERFASLRSQRSEPDDAETG